MKPGTYYLIAGGYSSETVGPATLHVHFTEGYVPNCMSRWCGPDGGGGSCGTEEDGSCAEGRVCDETLHCIAAPESDFCQHEKCLNGTAVCGDDGCGGTCGPLNGKCPGSQLCIITEGICQEFPVCNHMHPVCEGCTVNQFCGSDCQCYYIDDELPDLIPDLERLQASIIFEELFFDNFTCAYHEGCINGLGLRKLLRFDTTTINQGMVDMNLPDPTLFPNLYEYGKCHNHYHFTGYAEYRLISADNELVTTGKKIGYCMQDSKQESYIQGSNVRCKGDTTCEVPGISRGYSDVYGNDIDCQWIDVTGVAPGNYTLRIELNVQRRMMEATFENNAISVQVTIE